MLLISFDGLDSSGKATQARLLAEHLQDRGIQVAGFRSPDYETASGKELKLRLQGKLGDWRATSWQDKMEYFAANRAEHKDEVLHILAQGGVIIYDRYVPSSVAFMVSEANAAGTIPHSFSEGGLHVSRQDIQQAVQDLEYVKNAMPKEDVSIFFDIPPKLAIDLLKGRKSDQGDAAEYTDYLSVQEALHREYIHMAEKNPEHMLRISCMNGQGLRSIEEIAVLVRQALAQKFPDQAQLFI